jgi:Kef-type K+ transport system membrane component KefB
MEESPELAYVALLFALFVVPRVLLRWSIPSGVTSLLLGAASGIGIGWFTGDGTVGLLSTLGIVSLFLLAGLDVDLAELRRGARVLLVHVAVQAALLAGTALAAGAILGLEARPAVLLALALVTPSCGFILDSLAGLDLNGTQRFWVRSKAIATELFALGVLFVTLQSSSASRLALASGVLLAMIAVVPLVFRAFAAAVVPRAPKSEFAFLVMVAVVCAFATRELGVYYLVGAFVVGVTAQRFRERLPAMSSEKMLHAVEAFSTLFVPFYFFHAGLEIRREDLALDVLAAGGSFLAVVLPLRIGAVLLHRRASLGEPFAEGFRVSVPMIPTLVFSLVVAGILRERFEAPGYVVGGLVVYAVVNTMIPGLALGLPPAEKAPLEVAEKPAPPAAAPPGGGAG